MPCQRGCQGYEKNNDTVARERRYIQELLRRLHIGRERLEGRGLDESVGISEELRPAWSVKGDVSTCVSGDTSGGT